MKRKKTTAPSYALGIECGGTRTTALRLQEDGQAGPRREYPAANLRLIDDEQLRELFQQIAEQHEDPKCVGVGMAGVRTQEDRNRVRRQARLAWPSAKIYITDDLESALAGAPMARHSAQILIVSGTGSSCIGQGKDGRQVRVSGWGHLLGDEGGAYGIGLAGLRMMAREADRKGKPSRLLQSLLRRLGLSSPDELISWCQNASKAAVADVAVTIFSAWKRGHSGCGEVVCRAVDFLAADGMACYERMGRPANVQFFLSGGCFARQPRFWKATAESLRKQAPGCEVSPILPDGAKGAALLAGKHGKVEAEERLGKSLALDAMRILPESTAPSPTESRHPVSMRLDRLSIQEGIELMAAEDGRLPAAILSQTAAIEKTIRWTAKSLQTGGRLFYVGAGTSGRLGVLDASECPPTFGVDAERVQGVIAGGTPALQRAVEGTEDSATAGVLEMERRRVSEKDLVLGIAAGGKTPFVWGCLAAAKKARAKTVLLCFNPHLKFASKAKPNLVICPQVGPEVLTGSTRLKAGTATKMILNMVTTLSMARLGKVAQNLMVDLAPGNAKLRDRAVRILMDLTNCPAEIARKTLEANAWQVKKACRKLQSASRRKERQS